MISLIRKCHLCGEHDLKELNTTQAQYESWVAGELIQDAMPELSPEEREWCITGYCFKCQEKIFGIEE